MKALVFASLAVMSAIVDAADSEPKACTAQMCGRQYDLSPLSASSDYVLTSHSGRNFTLNVCRSVVSDLWNPSVERPQDVGGFTRGAHGDFSIGQANSTLHVRDANPLLYMTGGSSCPQASSMKASTAIQFLCDTSTEEGKPQLVAQLPPEDDGACAFFIEWRTKYACPVPDRYAYWKTAVMVIVILLALTLTILALLALHKLLKRRRLADPFASPSLSLPNGLGSANGFAGGIGGPRSWPGAIAERARDVKRLLTGQDPWGHPNGYQYSAASAPIAPTSVAPNANGDATTIGGRAGGAGLRSWLPSFPWSRSRSSNSRRGRGNFTRLPRSAEEEAMMGPNGHGGPFSISDDEDEEGHGHGHRAVHGVAAGAGAGGEFAEESAAWGSTRPRGMDGAGIIRL